MTSAADRRHLALMLALTFSTGVIDAVGYLGLDRVFTGNMTGNVVLLGMAVVGADDLPVLGPVVALLGFLSGAAVGGRVLKNAPSRGWTTRTTTLFGCVAGALALTGGVLVVDERPSHAVAVGVTAALGLAMGLQAATARVVAVKDVTTVVVTSTLTGLAADSVLGAGKPGLTGRRAVAVALITVGAGTGAALVHLHLAAGVLLAAALTTAVTIVGGRSTR
ncbi:MAG: YoaK family protein [Aeromicrobium sp.]|uniref:YoaK family protein n=1 Tax=Aeromicrobium sp. TaxID=1871063 RepID=UPI0039E6A0E4